MGLVLIIEYDKNKFKKYHSAAKSSGKKLGWLKGSRDKERVLDRASHLLIYCRAYP